MVINTKIPLFFAHLFSIHFVLGNLGKVPAGSAELEQKLMAGMWQIFGLENWKKRKSKYKNVLSLLAVQHDNYFIKLS